LGSVQYGYRKFIHTMVACVFTNLPCAIALRPPRGCVTSSPTVTCHFPNRYEKAQVRVLPAPPPPPCQVRFWIGAGAETRESKLKTTHLSTTTCRREHTRAETCIRHHQWICTAIAVPLDPSMKNLASWVATTEPTCRLYLYWFHISSHDWIGDLSVAAGYDKTHRNVMGRVIRCFATLAVTALPGDCRVPRKFGGGRDGEWLGPLSHRCTLLAHDINSHGS